ncbi:MAG: hypothetical protein ACRC8C_01765 [Mycoplasmoidaceae bacterium]
MQLEKEIALIEKIQKYNDEESLLILWKEYGEFVYKSFLKYIYYKNFNIPLESEDYLSCIFYAFKEAVIKFDINNQNYKLIQYLHIVTKSSASRYAKKFLTKKQNILNKAYMNTNPYQKPIENLELFSTKSLEYEYVEKVEIERKMNQIKVFLESYCLNNPKSPIREIIKLKLKNYNLKEISKELNIDHKKTYLYFDKFRKKFQIYIKENKII